MLNKIKRIIFLIFSFILCVSFCFSFERDDKFMYLAGHQYVTVEGDQVCIANKNKFQIRSFSDFVLKENGWYTCKFNGYDLDCIYGSDYFVLYCEELIYGDSFDSFPRVDDFYDYVRNTYPSVDFHSRSDDNIISLRSRKIETIIVPDILTEIINNRTVIYDTYDMQRLYAIEGEVGLAEFNGNAKPWATSKDPIGLTIQMNMIEPIDKVVILNGYVNPFKQYLYKANRRIKTAKFTSEEMDFEIIINFEDSVHFEQVTFPDKVKNINIEILDYFEGEKYTDLCVQSFGLPYEGINLCNTSQSIINNWKSDPRYTEYTD